MTARERMEKRNAEAASRMANMNEEAQRKLEARSQALKQKMGGSNNPFEDQQEAMAEMNDVLGGMHGSMQGVHAQQHAALGNVR